MWALVVWATLIVVGQSLLGCSEDNNPVEPQPWTGAVTLACHQWNPARPDAQRMIADLPLAPDDPTGPTAAQINELEAHGAKVLHAFNVPLARVDISLDSLEALEGKELVDSAEGVSFPNLYVVHGLVMGFYRPIEQADYEFLSAKGVHIDGGWDNILLITVEDDSIPALRSPNNEWYLELDYVYCGTENN